MQVEITEKGPLLSESGSLLKSGWAKHLYRQYDRKNVNAHPFRIKEWDFYEIRNPTFALVLVIFDVGYQGCIKASYLNFETKEEHEASEIIWFPKGNFNLPAYSDSANISYTKQDSFWKMTHESEGISFDFSFPKFTKKNQPTEKGFHGKVFLKKPKAIESIVNVIPFENPHKFVYAQKMNCLEASGFFFIGSTKHEFLPNSNSFGCLDWTRGVFPYKTEWCWASASGTWNDHLIGFNIDYGFGTESSKNMIFFDHKAHHLNEVTYSWNEKNLTDDWVFSSPDGRINLRLTPLHVFHDNTNFVILKMKVVKVFGFFRGEIILDSGEKIQISEENQIFGHAEHALNRW